LSQAPPNDAAAHVTPRQPAGGLADRLTWLGHATVLLELSGVRLLTDPVLRSPVVHLRRQTPEPADPAAVDAVLISHAHRDHLDVPSLNERSRA
jgi:L-ascorbate metabolism protein UlaG (beta-lactamase superfamily)